MNPRSDETFLVTCSVPQDGERLLAYAPTQPLPSIAAEKPLPKEIVWMPAGPHHIMASTPSGEPWEGEVICNQAGADAVRAAHREMVAAGYSAWFDRNHDNGEATFWVSDFEWDPARGIIARGEWTPLGEAMVREKRLRGFSPSFFVSRKTGVVAGLPWAMAAGGLVNAPAFGAAMPLLAAKLAAHDPSSKGYTPNQPSNDKAMKDKYLKILAALGVTPPDDAKDDEKKLATLVCQHLGVKNAAEAKNLKALHTQILAKLGVTIPDDAKDDEDKLAALVAKHAKDVRSSSTIDGLQAAKETLESQIEELRAKAKTPEESATVKELKQQVQALTAAQKEADKAKAETLVQAAVKRGAIKEDDTALQEKWVNLIVADANHADLLASMPDGKAKKPEGSDDPVIVSAVAQRAASGQVQITRAGLVDSLKAYAAKPAGTAQEAAARAEIYASVIAPIFRDDPDFRMGPVLAANSLGSLSGDLIVQRSLTLLKLSFPMLEAISTDFSPDSVAFEQQVTSRIRSIPAVANFVPGTGYATSNAVTTDVPVTIDNHKGVPISFNVNELANTSRNLFQEQAEGAQYALGKALVDALYALITPANFLNETVSTLNDFGRAKMSVMRKDLNIRGVPKMRRFALLSSDFADKLLSDTNLLSLAAFRREEIITEGQLPRVSGFQPYEAENLPTTDSLQGFAGTPETLVAATRVPSDYTQVMPAANHGNVSVVTNPDTGISVQLVQYIDHNLAAAFWRIALMFGVAKGQTASGQRLVDTATSS